VDPHPTTTLLANLDALAGALFLIAAFGIVATRQVQSCLRFFIAQSVFLAAAAFVLGARAFSWHLIAVGVINLVTKPWLVPYVLRRSVPDEVYTRREITQTVNIPTSLLIALALAVGAHFFTAPWLDAVDAGAAARVNLPIGLAGLLLGAYTLTARREAVPQLIGLLAMENGAFFAGIAVAPSLPLIPEVALAFDVLVLVFVVGVLTRLTHERTGTTAVGALATLREEAP
jgi:hydrogenase-4 component E